MIGIVDLFSRKVMAYNVANTMDAYHCVETFQLAVSRYGRPEIFNSDQGSQFTGAQFISALRGNDIRLAWTAAAAAWTTRRWSGFGGR